MEKLDVLDENGIKTGVIEGREVVHLKGLLHFEVTAFLYTQSGRVLLQKRSSNKKTYGNCWSTTGGHVLAGENNKQALIREIKEEIGISVNKEDIEHITTYKSCKTKGEIINNKFMGVYIVKVPDSIENFEIQTEELSEVKFFSIKQLEDIINNCDKNYKFPQVAMEVINYLKKNI